MIAEITPELQKKLDRVSYYGGQARSQAATEEEKQQIDLNVKEARSALIELRGKATLVITCKKSEDDICPAIYHFPNMGGFEDIDDLHMHWWRKRDPIEVQLFSDGLRLSGSAARPYHSQTWMLKREVPSVPALV